METEKYWDCKTTVIFNDEPIQIGWLIDFLTNNFKREDVLKLHVSNKHGEGEFAARINNKCVPLFTMHEYNKYRNEPLV
jgi:hypothetical protein